MWCVRCVCVDCSLWQLLPSAGQASKSAWPNDQVKSAVLAFVNDQTDHCWPRQYVDERSIIWANVFKMGQQWLLADTIVGIVLARRCWPLLWPLVSGRASRLVSTFVWLYTAAKYNFYAEHDLNSHIITIDCGCGSGWRPAHFVLQYVDQWMDPLTQPTEHTVLYNNPENVERWPTAGLMLEQRRSTSNQQCESTSGVCCEYNTVVLRNTVMTVTYTTSRTYCIHQYNTIQSADTHVT